MSQIPKNWNNNACTKVLLVRYNHNHGTQYVPVSVNPLRDRKI